MEEVSPDIPPVPFTQGDKSLLWWTQVFMRTIVGTMTAVWCKKGRKHMCLTNGMTPASDESIETHTRKVAETADVVERGLASRGLARVSR